MKSTIFRTLYLLSLAFAVYFPGLSGQNDFSVNITNACSNDGSIELVVLTEDYAPPFQFTWTDAEGNVLLVEENDESSVLTNLAPGNYCVTVASDDGCSAQSCGLVVGSELTIQSLTPICICPGGYGSAEVEVSGGSGNYAYHWELTGEQFVVTYTGLHPAFVNYNPLAVPPDTYTLTVTDTETGCQAVSSVEVDLCKGFDLASFIEVTPDCNEEGTSTISVQLPPNTALGPFEFRWTKAGVGLVEFEPSQDGFASLENAGPGEYCLNLRTMNGCEETVCGIMVESMPAPAVAYDISPGLGVSWTLSAQVTNGPGPFTYLWSDDNGSTTPSITVQEIDDYYVTVTDATSSCSTVTLVEMVSCDEMEQVLSFPNEIKAQVTPISSSGSLGAIDILNVADQYPGYNFGYLWSNGETTEDISGLVAGFYQVFVTSEECNFTVPGGPWQVCGFSVDFEVHPFLNNCDFADLKLNVSPPENYSYQWDDPAQSQTANISAQYGTEYCVTISIGNPPDDCSAVACITPEPPPIEIELVNLEHALFGLPTGLIEVDANVGPYSGLYELTYQWSNGNEGPVNQNLYPGDYTVTVSDDCGNTATATYNIQCELLESEIEAIVTDVPCSSNTGGSNTGGSITLTALPFSNGNANPTYSFAWSNGAQTQNLSDLAAGEYCVTIVEANTGCVVSDCFEVEASGAGNFTVSFDMQPGCYPLNEGQITANASDPGLGPFEYYWFNYNWSTNQTQYLGNTATLAGVPAGWYSVILTDAMGCTASNYTLMWPAPPSFGVAAVEDPVVVCKGGTGTGEVEVTFGIPPGPLTYEWTNFSTYPLETTSTGSQPVLEGMAPGSWAVTVTDGDGCQAFTNFLVQEAYLEVKSKIGDNCGKGSIELTPLTFQWLPANPPFSYLWSDGSTEQNRYDLESGEYCVTITNAIGCTSYKCFELNPVSNIFEVLAQVKDNGCDETQCSGSIELEISPPAAVTYSWADGNWASNTDSRYFLCPGDYTVTVTSQETGCKVVKTYSIGQAGGEPFEYDVDVLYYFGNKVNLFGDAIVNIQSDLFEYPGQISLYSSPQMTPPAVVTHSVSNPNTFNTHISESFSNVDPFYFSYTAPNNCIYEGSFPGIPTCIDDPTDGFSFVVNCLGDQTKDCSSGQSNSYVLDVSYMGENFPYFLEITMVDTYDPAESYEETIVINSYMPSISVEGIPAGTVQFKTYNLCDDGLFLVTHDNCCRGLNCGPISAGSTPQYEDSYRQHFPYFTLWTKKECFDANCPLWDICSELWIDENSNAPEPNCWNGTVTITFPDGSYGKFEVKDDPDNEYYDQINWLEGSHTWKPPSPGTYVVEVFYEGYEGNEDCINEVEVSFYGPGNFNESIIFLHSLPTANSGIYQNIPGEFINAYYAAKPCETCQSEDYYFDGNSNVEDCKEFDEERIQYFNFVPNDYNADDPCESGGMLTILDYDSEGDLTVFDNIVIPPNVAISSLQGIWPLNLSEGLVCDLSKSGWCLFDANLVPDPIYEVDFDKPILATYGDCEQSSNNDGDLNCLTDGCPDGYECDPVTGMCILLCDNLDCPWGQICNGEGYCVWPNECNCLPGYQCVGGNCYLDEDICDFYVSINENGGEQIFPFYHQDVPSGTTYTYLLYYNTITIPDNISVYHNGSLLASTGCVATGDDWALDPLEFQLTGGGDIEIHVTSMECDGGSTSSRYEFEIFCIEGPGQNGSSSNLTCGGLMNETATLVSPNPFTSALGISTEVGAPFLGEITLSDYMGQKIHVSQFEFSPENNTLQLQGFADLMPSVYTLTIRKDGEVCVARQVAKID